MNETKNQRLAREITDFCKERLMSPAVKSKDSKSALKTVLAAILAVTIATGAGKPDRSKWVV